MRPSSRTALGEPDDSLLSSPSVAHAHSTPRHPPSTAKRAAKQEPPPTYADYSSPYETLKRQMEGRSPTTEARPALPSTPAKETQQDDSTTPASSPFGGPPPSTAARQRNINHDPLLHRVLDKTYRIAATPHAHQRKIRPPGSVAATPGTANRTRTGRWFDTSPDSSPEVAAPQLRAEIFSSPFKAANRTPRTPGADSQTPGRKRFEQDRKAKASVWDSESDDEGMDFSPPKTMQFHIPQNRLLQTPAREASKKIVEDLLLTAGGDITETTGEFEAREEEDSPSRVVKRDVGLDDSF